MRYFYSIVFLLFVFMNFFPLDIFCMSSETSMPPEMPTEAMTGPPDLLPPPDMSPIEQDDLPPAGMPMGGPPPPGPADLPPSEQEAAAAPSAPPVPVGPPSPVTEYKQLKWPQAVELKEEGMPLVGSGFKPNIENFSKDAQAVFKQIQEILQQIRKLRQELQDKSQETDKRLDEFYQQTGFSLGDLPGELLTQRGK